MRTAQVRPYYVKKAFTFLGEQLYPGDVFNKTEDVCSPHKLGMLISNRYLDGYRTVSEADIAYLASGAPSKSKAAPPPNGQEEQAPTEQEEEETEEETEQEEETPTPTPRRRRR